MYVLECVFLSVCVLGCVCCVCVRRETCTGQRDVCAHYGDCVWEGENEYLGLMVLKK